MVVLFDSFRFRFTGYGGFQPSPCPMFDSLMETGITCSRMFAMGCPTMMSLPTIFTSTYPLDHGGYTFGIRDRVGKALQALLKAQGYRTSLTFNGACAQVFHFWENLDRVFLDSYLGDVPDVFLSYFFMPIIRGLVAREKTVLQCMRELEPILPEFFRQVEIFLGERRKDSQAKPETLSRIISHPLWNYPQLEDLLRKEKSDYERNSKSYVRRFFLARMVNYGWQKFFPAPVYERDLFGTISVRYRAILQEQEDFFQTLGKTLACGDKELHLPQLIKEISSAGAVVNNQLEWIDQNKDQPFFSWIHFFDTHPPGNFFSFDTLNRDKEVAREWESLREYYACLDQTDLSPNEVRYLFSARYLDTQLRRILDFLSEKQLLDDTFVVVMSDHGINFPGRPSRPGSHVTHSFFDEFYHIPFVISNPSLLPLRYDGLASTVDILPTLLDLLEIPLPQGIRGKSLVDPRHTGRDFVFMEHFGRKFCDPRNNPIYVCVRSATKKIVYVGHPLSSGKPREIREIYDLEKDPQEFENLALSAVFDRDTVKDLIRFAEARVQEVQKTS